MRRFLAPSERDFGGCHARFARVGCRAALRPNRRATLFTARNGAVDVARTGPTSARLLRLPGGGGAQSDPRYETTPSPALRNSLPELRSRGDIQTSRCAVGNVTPKMRRPARCTGAAFAYQPFLSISFKRWLLKADPAARDRDKSPGCRALVGLGTARNGAGTLRNRASNLQDAVHSPWLIGPLGRTAGACFSRH